MFGFYETLIEYYTGRDASLMTDDQMAMKLAHIERIRTMEQKSSIIDKFQNNSSE